MHHADGARSRRISHMAAGGVRMALAPVAGSPTPACGRCSATFTIRNDD